MNTFQIVVCSIAVIILIICLIAIGYALNYKKYNTEYPPVVEDCPDYWLDLSDGDTSNCVNVKNLGNCPGPKDFSTSIWQGKSGLCNKYHWANRCNIKWDGVTNARDPCNNKSGSDSDSDDDDDGPCPICPSNGAS